MIDANEIEVDVTADESEHFVPFDLKEPLKNLGMFA